MATISQIQSGFTRFLDLQLSAAFTGWQRAVVLGGGALFAKNLPVTLARYADHPVIALLGIYDTEAGTVDINALREALAEQLGAEKIPVPIPGLGTVKLGREDIDTLCRYIEEAS